MAGQPTRSKNGRNRCQFQFISTFFDIHLVEHNFFNKVLFENFRFGETLARPCVRFAFFFTSGSSAPAAEREADRLSWRRATPSDVTSHPQIFPRAITARSLTPSTPNSRPRWPSGASTKFFFQNFDQIEMKGPSAARNGMTVPVPWASAI